MKLRVHDERTIRIHGEFVEIVRLERFGMSIKMTIQVQQGEQQGTCCKVTRESGRPKHKVHLVDLENVLKSKARPKFPNSSDQTLKLFANHFKADFKRSLPRNTLVTSD